MECPNCSHKNRGSAKFCSECGLRLEFSCPECGTANQSGSKFCDECGHDLGKPAETPIDYSEPSSYTPGFLADKILTNRGGIEGERKLVTVFFADVAGFTSLSEKLDPEDVHNIMDGCFKVLLDEIHKHEGTVNQFTGDGVMAIFGAPVAHEEHAQRACHEDAEKHILEGIEILKKHQRKILYPLGYLFLGELYADKDQKKEATKYLKMAEALYQEMGFVFWLGRIRSVLGRLS